MFRVVLVFILIALCYCLPHVDIKGVDGDNQGNVAESEELIRYHYANAVEEFDHIQIDKLTIPQKNYFNLTSGFSWKNCGDSSDDVQLKTLTVSPDPIEVPGTLTVSLDATINTVIQTATSVQLVVKKSLFGVFVEVPCVDNFGSCTYKDPCSLLAKVTCPPELVALGWTCRCPIPAKHYVVPITHFKIPQLPIPSSLENGDYEVQATLMNGNTRLACYEVKASLKKNS